MDPDDDKYKKEPYYISETVSSNELRTFLFKRERESDSSDPNLCVYFACVKLGDFRQALTVHDANGV